MAMIVRATEEDLPEIVSLQRLAFKEEAEFVRDPGIKPMVQTLDEVREEYFKGVVLKYVENGEIVGSVRARAEGTTCHIARLVVRPDHRGRGIGRALMNDIERRFAHVQRFELFTREDHERNRPFYASLGYLPFRTEKVSDTLTFVHLQKANVR